MAVTIIVTAVLKINYDNQKGANNMPKPIQITYAPISHNHRVQTILSQIETAKSAISKLRPFNDPDMLKQTKAFYKTDFVWSSEALEGNSISKGETQIMIENGVTVEGHPLKDILSTSGQADAFDEMFRISGSSSITIDDILRLHQTLMQKERPDIAGKLKTKPNIITGSNFTTISPSRVAPEMRRLNNWMANQRLLAHPVLQAAELHRKLVYIHPFTDGNGRTARLAMNAVLIQNGYLPVSISPYMKRDYNSALELGRQGDQNAFYEFIANAEYEAEKDFCRYMNIALPKSKIIPQAISELANAYDDAQTESSETTFDED